MYCELRNRIHVLIQFLQLYQLVCNVLFFKFVQTVTQWCYFVVFKNKIFKTLTMMAQATVSRQYRINSKSRPLVFRPLHFTPPFYTLVFFSKNLENFSRNCKSRNHFALPRFYASSPPPLLEYTPCIQTKAFTLPNLASRKYGT